MRTRCSEIDLTFGVVDNPDPPYDDHSERSACITSTRAARAAGRTDAIRATVISTNAETATGNAPGIFSRLNVTQADVFHYSSLPVGSQQYGCQIFSITVSSNEAHRILIQKTLTQQVLIAISAA